MKAKTILFFLLLSTLIPLTYAADFGEDDPYLGQVVDSYLNDNYIQSNNSVIHNETLDCMELNYTDLPTDIYENFSTYTEVDENNRITVFDHVIDVDERWRTESGYVYKDFGVGYFSGDYDFKIEVEITAGDTQSTYEWFSVVTNDTGPYTSQTNMQGVSLRSALDPRWQMQLWDKGGAGAAAQYAIAEDTRYYLNISRTGSDLYCYVHTDLARTVLIHTFHLSGVQETPWRYMQADMSFDYATGVTQWLDVNCANLTIIEAGWAYLDGEYYTTEMLDGDIGLVLIYNASIPEDTGITMEFSSDNSTWVDHNNQSVYETLISGFESIDLRDLNTSSLYIRVNMTTTDRAKTPRMYQLRFVTITAQPTTDDGLFPGLAIGISLLIIGAAYLVENRR